MPGFCLQARPPEGDPGPAAVVRDADVVGAHLEDAAHFPGGHATELVRPSSESQIAQILRRSASILPIGAQSSLTGGATPMGELLLSTTRLNRIERVGTDSVRVQVGVTMAELDRELERVGRYYPPGPTFAGAFVGGTVATNAAGAATFKYGQTRAWVQGLTVVLPCGAVLDVERGTTRAHADGYFELRVADRTVRIDVPRYRMPPVPKLSAGYFAAPGMDLIDLFIGSEGTLGVVTAVTLRVLSVRPAVCLVFVAFSDRGAALRFVRQLRESAMATWRTRDPRGVDVSAIEHLDARCLALIKEEGLDRANGVRVSEDARLALLVTLELPQGTGAEQAFDEIGQAGGPGAPDTPLVRFCSMLSDAGVLDRTEIAVPGDRARAAQLLAVREAAPSLVNQRVGRAKQTLDSRIEKTGADMIVPFDRLDEMLAFYDAELRRRGLDGAVWGHVSDGNLHPNVIPRSFADVESGKAAILEFGREALRLGGAPLAEHGVGRNLVKQQLLRMMYGAAGVDEMRRVKGAIDPSWKLAPGVLFPRWT
jgi:D-lactate dehydrogenase (cytochrome)